MRIARRRRTHIARAHEELVPLGHNYVGTEHLVLGVVLSGEGAVPGLLVRLRIEAEAVTARRV